MGDDYTGRTLYEILQEAATLYGKRPALYFEGRTFTYQEVKQQVDALTRGLQRVVGMEKGHNVGGADFKLS